MNEQKENFIRIFHSVLKKRDLTDADKITLSIIQSWTINGRQCFMGNEYIGEFIGISSTAASKRVQKLKDKGLIDVTYILRKGTKEVEKRIITMKEPLSMESKEVSSETQEVSSELREVSSETQEVSSKVQEVSSEVGGIRIDIIEDIRKDIKVEDKKEHQYTGQNQPVSNLKRYYGLGAEIENMFPNLRNKVVYDCILNNQIEELSKLAGISINLSQIEIFDEFRNLVPEIPEDER
jgi:DNA-binding Lrp family transcriptional regulator